MGGVGIASCEAWNPEEKKLTAHNVTELLAEDTKAIVIRTLEHTDGETLFTIEGFHMTIIGSPEVHDITDLDFTISISFRTLKADMGQAKIEIQSGESDSVVYVSAKYDNEAGALKSTIVLNNLGGTVDFNIAQDGNDLAVHVENTMAMALITSSDMEDFQIEIGTMVDLISIDAETENGEIHHVAKNFLIDGKTAISTSQISGGIAAVLMDLIAEFEGEVSLGELKLAYGETTIFFNGLRIDAAGLNAVAETFSATNVNVDGVSYDSVVAFDGEKLPAALSGVFAVTPFSYEAGLIGGSAPAGLITLHVETGRTTFNGETVAYPNGTGLLVEKPVVFHGVADLAVKAGDVVALIGTGTITLATDAKDVTNGDVIDISSGDVVISDENLAAMPGNDVVLKNDKVSITIPKSAMSKMIDGRAVSLSADVSIGVTAYDVLSKLSDADKQKVQGAVVIDIDASTAAVTDDLGNIYLVIPVDLQQLGMKKSAISAYYNNNGVLEKVRAIYYEENGQGYVKVGTTHFSEYIVCEELELGQKDNSIVHILMTLIVVVIAIAAILVIRENSRAKA
ncbi:MAG: hypothetical protein MJZ38_04990, partial [archaeon]|nr:hypothetical protein [archaeon]